MLSPRLVLGDLKQDKLGLHLWRYSAQVAWGRSKRDNGQSGRMLKSSSFAF